MAETELTALLVERGALHGVKVSRTRDGLTQSGALTWPVEAATAEGTAPAADTTPDDPLVKALRAARAAWGLPEGCALALPTSELMLKVLNLPPADPSSLGDIVRLQMEKVAPYAGDELSVGYEVLASGESGLRVFAAAAAKPALDALAARLGAGGVRITRLDVGLLGWWRQLVDARLPGLDEGRCAVLFGQGGEWDLLVLDGGQPVVARGLGTGLEPADLARELTLSCLGAELECGPAPTRAVWVVAEQAPDRECLAALRGAAGVAPEFVPRERLGKPGLGVARRSVESPPRLDLVPAAWRAEEQAQRTRRRFMAGLGAAAALWVLLAAALWLAPFAVRHMTAGAQARVQANEAPYRAAADVRMRVRLIRSYMDRSHSLIEVMRTACTVMPLDIDLASVSYRREDGAKFSGDAGQPSLVYEFKDALDASGLFAGSVLSGPTLDVARRRHRFEIDAKFGEDAE